MNAARRPDIVCIGAQKAGTSWLHQTLGGRPDIWVPPFKEMHFFDQKFIMECRRWAPWHVKKGLKEARRLHMAETRSPDVPYLDYLTRLEERPSRTATWYEYVFSRAGAAQRCLDVTPEYSCIPEVGIDYFKRFLPRARLIYLVRDPLDRLRSQLRMMIQRRATSPTSEAEWNALLQMSALDSRGDYLTNIPRWDARFDHCALLYLPFGQIKPDPRAFLQAVEAHCGLPPHDYDKPEQRVHPSKPVSLPPFVEEHLHSKAAGQYEFLEARFGRDFVRLTK